MKKLICKLGRILPFGFMPIASISEPEETVTLYKNGMVVVSDGSSTDMLPISLCSPALINKFVHELNT